MTIRGMISALMGFAFAAIASAGSVTLQWDATTANTDGSALIAPATYAIYQSSSPGGTKQLVASNLSGLTYTINGLVGGSKPCFTAVAVVGGATSVTSNETCTTVPVPTPNPPANLRVTATTAYAPTATTDAFRFVAVGKVRAGTACISSQYVNGLHAVPRSTVTWTGTSRPPVVVAACS